MLHRTLLTCKTHWNWTFAALVLLVCVVHAAPIGKPADFPCYERDMQPLIAQRCGSCHANNTETVLSSYEQAKRNSYGMLRDVMGGNMPLAKPLPTEEASMFKAWHENGALLCTEPGKPSPIR